MYDNIKTPNTWNTWNFSKFFFVCVAGCGLGGGGVLSLFPKMHIESLEVSNYLELNGDLLK